MYFLDSKIYNHRFLSKVIKSGDRLSKSHLSSQDYSYSFFPLLAWGLPRRNDSFAMISSCWEMCGGEVLKQRKENELFPHSERV